MVSYHHQMLDDAEGDLTSPPDEGVYVYGLYLEGCGWDTKLHSLCESEQRVLFSKAPCMWLKPYETRDLPNVDYYACPLYRTAERKGTLATTGHSTNFVMYVKLPSDRPPNHWVMRGVALLSQLSD